MTPKTRKPRRTWAVAKKRTGKKAGRKPLPIDPKVVEAMATVGATNQEIADFVGCGDSTIARRFGRILTKSRSRMRIRLREKQYELAVSGNVSMLIWLGKQLLGQTDAQRVQVGGTEGTAGGKPLRVVVDLGVGTPHAAAPDVALYGTGEPLP